MIYYNEMNFGMNHAPGAASIVQLVLICSPARYHCATTAPFSQPTTPMRVQRGCCGVGIPIRGGDGGCEFYCMKDDEREREREGYIERERKRQTEKGRERERRERVRMIRREGEKER